MIDRDLYMHELILLLHVPYNRILSCIIISLNLLYSNSVSN